MKTMIITGTRKGLGKIMAEYYLEKGFQVCGCSRKEANINHEHYHHYEVNVSDEKAVVHMVRDVKKKYGPIAVLLNNAGIASMNQILLTPTKTVQNIFATNFLGSFLFLREVAKTMTKNKQGRIVNFSTVAVPLRLEGEAIYAASKAALVSLTEITAKELASFNITVNTVGPTPIATDLIKNVPKNKINELLQQQAIPRLGQASDVINVIDFFIDPNSHFITGQTLYLGGVPN